MSPAWRGGPRSNRGGLGRRGGSVVLLLCVGVAGLALILQGSSRVDPPPAPLPSRPFAHAGPAGPPSPQAPGPAELASYGVNRLVIPSLGVNALVVPEPLAPDGDLVVPGDPLVVGRWQGGPPVRAASGTSLMAGHVSVADVGLGALHELHRVAPGALVITTDEAGVALTWRVDSLESRRKDDLPDFPRAGPRRLALVTCGGPAQRDQRGRAEFRDNVIAVAVPG